MARKLIYLGQKENFIRIKPLQLTVYQAETMTRMNYKQLNIQNVTPSNDLSYPQKTRKNSFTLNEATGLLKFKEIRVSMHLLIIYHLVSGNFLKPLNCCYSKNKLLSDKHPKNLFYVISMRLTSKLKAQKGACKQGELKKRGKDPLFYINHTLAMLRANVNRLIRKTWCTTKDPAQLIYHLAI